MNNVATIQKNAIEAWSQQNPALAARGIDEPTWNALKSSLYPGAKDASIILAVDYCRSRQLDVMLKPVHLVPMNVKDAQTGKYDWRDVPMPGVGMYRIQADRSGNYAGADAPEFGPDVTESLTNKTGNPVEVTYPQWCKYTVHKVVGDRLVSYTALERWKENYATDSSQSTAPNSMWLKRPYAQLAKCAEAQALRKGWPEIGQDPTAEEMEGKAYQREEKDITPRATQPEQLPVYTEAEFQKNLPSWEKAIFAGKANAEFIKNKVSTMAQMTDAQFDELKNIELNAAAAAQEATQ